MDGMLTGRRSPYRQDYSERNPKSKGKKRKYDSEEDESDADADATDDDSDDESPTRTGQARHRLKDAVNRIPGQLGSEVQYRCELCKQAMRGRCDTWWEHRLGKQSCIRKKGKSRKKVGEQAKSKAKGFGKAPSPVRREPTFLDKLVLKQPPPADMTTAVQYDGASFVRQSAPVAPPKPAKPKADIKPRRRRAAQAPRHRSKGASPWQGHGVSNARLRQLQLAKRMSRQWLARRWRQARRTRCKSWGKLRGLRRMPSFERR